MSRMEEAQAADNAFEEEWIAGFPPWWADWLVDQGSAKSKEDGNRLLRMMRAIEDGDAASVQMFLQGGIDPNTQFLSGWGSLLECALQRSANPAIAKLLIDAGADTSKRGILYDAVSRTGFGSVAEKLLDSGRDPNSTVDGISMLGMAAMTGNLAMVKLLLKHGAKVDSASAVYPNNKEKVSRCTPLMLAASSGHLGIVKTLLAAGSHVDRRDSAGNTALDWARLRKSKRAETVVELLVQEGAVRGAGEDFGIVNVPDFRSAAKAPAFQHALQTLEALTGSKPRKIELEEESVKGGFAFLAEEDRAREIVTEFQDQMLGEGCFLFWSCGVTERGDTSVVALPTMDQFQAVAAIQTAGPNSGVTTGDVIDWLKELERDQPLRIHGIGPDFLEGYFTTDLKDAPAIASRIAALCPNGASSPSELATYANHLSTTRRLFLWWD